mmetsp:Transcript_41458/g.123861  ORF Transcript_41458/g.123861 Transcript_41458/m.123861 type:complete len:441 (+) Transcript_41458:1771-3093(+)
MHRDVGRRLQVEAQQQRIGRRRQVHVAGVDVAGAAEQVTQRDRLLRQRRQRRLDRLHHANRLRLDDQVELLHHLRIVVHRRKRRQCDHRPAAAHVAQALRAVPSDVHRCGVASLGIRRVHLEVLPGVWHAVQPRKLQRRRGACLVDGLPQVVDHRPDLPVATACRDDVAHAQSASLDQQAGDRALAAVKVRLDDSARSRLFGVGRKALALSHQAQHLHQVLDAGALLCRHVHHGRVPAPLLRYQIQLQQLLLYALRVGARLVNLVDRHHDRHPRRLRVRHRLPRLRPHAVVRRDDDDGDVGHSCAARAHRGERLVARGIEEADGAFLTVNLHAAAVRADALSDAAGLPAGHARLPNVVQQARLAVVNVSHDCHDGRARQQVIDVVLRHKLRPLGRRIILALVLVHTKHIILCSHHFAGVFVQNLVHAQHDAFHEEGAHKL